METPHPVIRTRDLAKVYDTGAVKVEALRGVELEITAGEFVAVMGASGSGKSTLLNILGCLDYPSRGDYFIDGVHMNTLGRDQLADIRNQKIGFVFQGFNLLPRTCAFENVEVPLLYARDNVPRDIPALALAALGRVGLADRRDHFPNQLSGGEQQRVAIARALVNRPSLLLADEPTGNLDSRTSIEIMILFQELNRQGLTILMVTHEHDISGYARRIVEFRDGRIVRDHPAECRDAVADLARMPSPEA